MYIIIFIYKPILKSMMTASIDFLIIHTLVFSALLIASYTDLKTREVPDWLNYGLMAAGLGLNLLFTIIFWKWQFFVNSLIGFAVFFAIAWIMFYTGQWGGGDSKILMGLGALIGVSVIGFKGIFNDFLIIFLINVVIIGALYGLFWIFFLTIKNFNRFKKEFKKISSNKKINTAKKWILILSLIMVLLIVFVLDSSMDLIFAYLAVVILLTFYIWLFVKAVEKSCMIKLVNPKELTEGDWIAKDIKVKGKYIAGPKDLGIEKKQIKELIRLYQKRKIKKVLMKIGIPFVPSFFIAYIITLAYGNLVLLFI